MLTLIDYDDKELLIEYNYTPPTLGDYWTPPTHEQVEICEISHEGVDVTNDYENDFYLLEEIILNNLQE